MYGWYWLESMWGLHSDTGNLLLAVNGKGKPSLFLRWAFVLEGQVWPQVNVMVKPS